MEKPVAQDGNIRQIERRAYRPREIARMYGLAPSTIYDAIYREKLGCIRKGRAVIVLAEELTRWLANDDAA